MDMSFRIAPPNGSPSPHAAQSIETLADQIYHIGDLLKSGKSSEAARHTERLTRQFPNDPRIKVMYAKILRTAGAYEAALDVYDRLLFHQETPEIWSGKAALYNLLKEHRKAVFCIARARAISHSPPTGSLRASNTYAPPSPKPETAGYLLTHAREALKSGQIAHAYDLACSAALKDHTAEALTLARLSAHVTKPYEKLCHICLNSNPSPAVMAMIAWDFPAAFETKNIDNLHKYCHNSQYTVEARAKAHLALFRLHDYADERMEALAHLRKYHELSAEISRHKRSHDSAEFTNLKRLKFPNLPPSPVQIHPIFLTGLPGSGHCEAVQLMRENNFEDKLRPLSPIPVIIARFIKTQHSLNAISVDERDMIELQIQLRNALTYISQGQNIIIDTQLLNFKYSGLLAAALPEARIIHMHRDPLVTGWAIHKGETSEAGFGCRHNLKHIAAFQRRAHDLMQYWEGLYSGQIFPISGDALARKSGATAQFLLRSAGLKPRASIQLPQSSSLPDWQRYASYLMPLRQEVEKKEKESSFWDKF